MKSSRLGKCHVAVAVLEREVCEVERMCRAETYESHGQAKTVVGFDEQCALLSKAAWAEPHERSLMRSVLSAIRNRRRVCGRGRSTPRFDEQSVLLFDDQCALVGRL